MPNHITQPAPKPAPEDQQIDYIVEAYRKLKAISGKSTAVFVRSIRLQKGKELIQTTENTISEIAYEVGFNDPAWFSRAFKEEYGYAPSAIPK